MNKYNQQHNQNNPSRTVLDLIGKTIKDAQYYGRHNSLEVEFTDKTCLSVFFAGYDEDGNCNETDVIYDGDILIGDDNDDEEEQS